MIQFAKLKSGLVLVIALSAQTAALALSDLEVGKKLYSEGKFDRAARCFQAVIAEDAYDANAHYLLGNSLLALKRAPAAINEYRAASQLDTSGEAGRYSRQALMSLTSSQSVLIAPNSKIEPADESDTNKSNNTDIRHSVNSISKSTNERAAQINAECDSNVKRMIEEGDGKVKRLEAEMRERIESNGKEAWSGSPSCNRSVKYYDPELENKVIREEYAPKIEAVKNDYKRRAAELTVMYRQKAAAFEDSTFTPDRTNLQSNKEIKLSPLGTSMHVRTYKKRDEPTGSLLPVPAAEAKSLKASAVKK